MKKLFLLFAINAFFISSASTQNLNLILRSNSGIGFSYRTIGGATYSPGGGSGFEVGANKDLGQGFLPYMVLGYHAAFTFQANTGANGNSSAFIDRKYLGFGAQKLIPFGENAEKKAKGILLGFGGLYAFPSKLSERNDGVRAPKITYKPTLGFTVEVAVNLVANDRLHINPGIRYRQLKFDSKEVASGDISSLPSELVNLDASGLDISLTFIIMGKSQ